MKKKSLYTIFLAIGSLIWTGCSDKNFSEDYDINFPVAKVFSTSNATPFVDDEITLKGENLQTATSINIDAYKFTVVSTSADGTSVVVKVPRSIDAGNISTTNKYKRVNVSEVTLNPQFYETKVTSWPTEIQLGKPFKLEGTNMDLIKEVKVNGTAVSVAGATSETSASYTTKEADIAVGDEVTIEVTPKAGDAMTSNPIMVVKPTNTYICKSTLSVLDINSNYVVENGNDAASCTMKEVKGLLGKAFNVSAPVGDGWNGTYCKIYSDNGGKGYDLSTYNNPCITMLINTNGKKGYMQPIITVNGSEEDKHLTSAFGYKDDYSSQTDGWEWRSYSLEALGFSVSKGKIDKIGVQFRGGNVGNGNTDPFDISVNMVMITDGPLNPTVAWDCETPVASMGKFVLKDTGSGGLLGVSEGDKFASYTAPILKDWDWMTDCTIKVPGINVSTYANGIWLNVLVNTGNNFGNAQIEYGNTSGLDWFNFLSSQGYGDDYTIKPTNNKWVWRSVRFDPAAKGLDLTQEFYLKFGATTGNWKTGTFELNFDYVVLTTAPMDPTLNTDDFK